MRLPKMQYLEDRTQKNIIRFLGVNYGENTRDGQFAACRNLSSRMFPCLSQRPGRERQDSYESATSVWYKDGLIVVDGENLLYKGKVIGTVTPGRKQFATVNTKVVIFPDKVMLDTATNELTSLSAEQTVAGGLTFDSTKGFFVGQLSYEVEVTGSGNVGGTPENIEDAKYFSLASYPFDGFFYKAEVNDVTGLLTLTAADNKMAREIVAGDLFYDADLGMDGVTTWGCITKVHSWMEEIDDNGTVKWVSVGKSFDYDTYRANTIYPEGGPDFDGFIFKVGDTVEISGCTTLPENNGSYTIRDLYDKKLENGTTYHGLVFDPDLFTMGKEDGTVTIKRSVPDLTVICEHDNRLYGAAGNTIYVSALGDPTNFYTYDGLDTDSYAVAVATEGEFTGCIGYGTSVLFFQEDRLYKLMGSYPSQYTLYDYTVPGVLKGSENSLWNVNEVVYYHGREGVYRYSGGAPDLITEDFGLRRFDTAAAGANGDTYYISMRDKRSGTWGMWAYDILRGIWLQEDESEAVCFVRDGGKLYYIDGDNRLVLVNPDSSEEQLAWSATLCRMDEVYLNRKCYSKILMRLELEEDAWVKIEVACDGGAFVEHKMFSRSPHKTVLVPIRPNRCDSFQIRLTGEGRVVIRSLVREFELGSDF